jgi:hypothetical protein
MKIENDNIRVFEKHYALQFGRSFTIFLTKDRSEMPGREASKATTDAFFVSYSQVAIG